MHTLKSIGAVLAGFIAIVVLSTGTDFLLEKAGVFPALSSGTYTTGMLLLALFYRCIYAVVGGYITATLAPNKPLQHAGILGVIGLSLSIAGAVAMWDKGNHWYAILLAITAFPTTWLGGKLKVNREDSLA